MIEHVPDMISGSLTGLGIVCLIRGTLCGDDATFRSGIISLGFAGLIGAIIKVATYAH